MFIAFYQKTNKLLSKNDKQKDEYFSMKTLNENYLHLTFLFYQCNQNKKEYLPFASREKQSQCTYTMHVHVYIQCTKILSKIF